MLDKVYYVNDNHVVIYFDTHHVNVRSDNGDALDIAATLLCPFPMERLEKGREFDSMIELIKISEEDTVIIDINKVA